MAVIASAQSGNWSATTTWAGGVVPGDGDWVMITHAVVIDQNIGTAGAGIQNIVVNGASASLSVDNSAPRTILFASTGSDPIGSGTAANPGSNATMFGFYIARGELSLVGTSANKITINSGNDASPWYIRHGGADLGNVNVPAKFTIQYCDMENLGANVTGFNGIHHERADATNHLVVENNTFTNFFTAVRASAPQSGSVFKFNNNSGSGNSSDICFMFNVWTSPEIKGNSFTAPLADGKHLAIFVHGANSAIIDGNTYTSTSNTIRARLVTVNSTGANCVISNNTLSNSLSSSSSPSAIVVQGTGPHVIEGNTIVGSKSAFNTLGQTINIRRNFFYLTTANMGTSHAPLELSRGNITVENNIILGNFTTVGLGIFAWDTSETGGVPAKTDITALRIYYNTVVNLAPIVSQASNITGIGIGQGGDPVGGVEIVGNIAYGWRYGIRDTDPLDQNAFVAGRVSNNLGYNCESAASVSGTTGGENWNGGGLLRTGNPNFANAGGTTAQAYYITAGGDGIGYGETTCAPAVDFVGTTRDAQPDIGAFEYIVSDALPPVISSLSAVGTGATTATLTVTTDEGNGSIFFLIDANATATEAAILAGLSQSVTATGEQTIDVTALDHNTTYYAHVLHRDAANNVSNILHSAQFTTDAIAVKGATITLHAGAMPQANLTDIVALWWDATTPGGAPAYSTTTASTDASGVLTLDLDVVTALEIGASGFLLLYKLDATDHRDSLVFAGRVAVSDIA